MVDFSRARDRMIASHLSRRGISDPDVLEAMRTVPREAFVDPGFQEFAYRILHSRSVTARLFHSPTSLR